MDDLKLYEELIRIKRSGGAAALITIVESNGSSPRKSGAKMLVRMDGSSIGTIGGGAVEAEVISKAGEAMGNGIPLTARFNLTEQYGHVCGGSILVYIEPLGRTPRLIIFGVGHVGRAVARLAKASGFRVIMVDERAELADLSQLPGTDEVICCDIPSAFSRLEVDGDTFILIATNSHETDFSAATKALRTPAFSIGMLGSMRKRETLAKLLDQQGFATNEIARITIPVGLAIGAETPEEIAVSIVAQLIATRRNHASAGLGNSPGSRSINANGTLQAAPSAP